MRFTLRVDGGSHDVVLERDGGAYRVRVDGVGFDVRVERRDGVVRSSADGKTIVLQRRGRLVSLDGAAADVAVLGLGKGAGPAAASAAGAVHPPMPGRVRAVLVAAGDEVRAGQPLVVLEAMKMQNEIAAPGAGRVAKVLVRPGQTVEPKDVLLVLESL